jgi:YHS domain-containing protein
LYKKINDYEKPYLCFSGSLPCNDCLLIGPRQKRKTMPDTVAMKTDSTANVLDHLLVNNKKDPACGMPVSAGISDTAHYKNLVLGFCSKECKQAFEKNPEGLIAAAEIKK